MEDFTDEEFKIIMEGGEYTNTIKMKIKEKEKISEERLTKMVNKDKFKSPPCSKEKQEKHERMFLSLNETQKRLYHTICLELYGGIIYISEKDNIINTKLEVERVNNILETLFNIYKTVIWFLRYLRRKNDINKPIKFRFKSKTTKSFLIDMERILNNFKKDNIKDEIERLESLLEFFFNVDAEIRGN